MRLLVDGQIDLQRERDALQVELDRSVRGNVTGSSILGQPS